LLSNLFQNLSIHKTQEDNSDATRRYSLLGFYVEINFEKACLASFFKIYLGFKKTQSAV